MRVALTLQVALVTALGGSVAGVVAGLFSVSTLDVGAAVGLRAVLVAAAVLVAPYLLVRRRVLTARRGELVAAGVVGLVVGFALDPLAWNGRAFFSQSFAEPGLLTMAVDLAGWLILGSVAVLAASRAAATRHQPLGYER